jgi:hypothetical protein
VTPEERAELQALLAAMEGAIREQRAAVRTPERIQALRAHLAQVQLPLWTEQLRALLVGA